MFSESISLESSRRICLRLMVALLVSSAAIIPVSANEIVASQQPVAITEINDGYFLPDLHCQFVCADGNTENAVVTRGFHTSKNGLLPGDGSGGRGAPWGSFTGTLEAWSQMECLEAAVKGCGALDQVRECDLQKITSGSWVLDRRVICPDERQAEKIGSNDQDPRGVFPDYVPVLSPFSPESGAIRTRNVSSVRNEILPVPDLGAVLTGPGDNPTLRRVDEFEYWMDRAITFLEVPDRLTKTAEVRYFLLESTSSRSEEEYVVLMQIQNGIGPALPCSAVIRGRACYGDCLEFPEGREREEYMATNKVNPQNVGSIAVCGDQLASFFADHPMSVRAKAIYCEKYLMDSVVAGRSTAFTCSSYRIRADCSSLF